MFPQAWVQRDWPFHECKHPGRGDVTAFLSPIAVASSYPQPYPTLPALSFTCQHYQYSQCAQQCPLPCGAYLCCNPCLPNLCIHKGEGLVRLQLATSGVPRSSFCAGRTGAVKSVLPTSPLSHPAPRNGMLPAAQVAMLRVSVSFGKQVLQH